MDAHIRKVYVPMTETAFYILLCLKTPNHGFGGVQMVERLTEGAIKLAPGTMYGSLSKMLPGLLRSIAQGEGVLAALLGIIVGLYIYFFARFFCRYRQIKDRNE